MCQTSFDNTFINVTPTAQNFSSYANIIETLAKHASQTKLNAREIRLKEEKEKLNVHIYVTVQ